MIKEDAEKEVARLNDPDQYTPDWFCPLIKTLCNPVCVCYQKAYTREKSVYIKGTNPMQYTSDFITIEPSCDNAMFNNQCGCNN